MNVMYTSLLQTEIAVDDGATSAENPQKNLWRRLMSIKAATKASLLLKEIGWVKACGYHCQGFMRFQKLILKLRRGDTSGCLHLCCFSNNSLDFIGLSGYDESNEHLITMQIDKCFSWPHALWPYWCLWAERGLRHKMGLVSWTWALVVYDPPK